MGFRYVPNPTFPATVQITVPGAAAPAPLEVVFKHKSRKEAEAWFASIDKSTLDIDVVAEIVADMPGLEDEQGQPVPYSREVLARLLDEYHIAGLEILLAYRTALRESRAKN